MLKLTASKSRACDTCHSAGSTVYCRSDSAFLCTACDAQIHANAANHERVWVCEACEQNPSAYQCKADAASLCVSCDVDIHSANPLARRHHRVPVLPIPGLLYGPSGHGLLDCNNESNDCKEGELCEEDELTESWLMMKNGGGGEEHTLAVDEYLDLEEYGNMYQGDNDKNNSNKNDSIVPFRSEEAAKDDKVRQCWFQLGLEFEGSSNAEYGYPITSMNDSTVISLPSMDVGVVPESTITTSELSISQHQRSSKGIIDLFMDSAVDLPTQLSPSEREARVLRYREKKKTRKFEKTIRYASRKAYAETRPRIKGRFAKRTDVEAEVDQMFSTDPIMAETDYGIVPSF